MDGVPTRISSKLPAFDDEKKQWYVVIETPKGSSNKYKYDEELETLVLSVVMPEGMSFPYDFGLIPRTLGDDGDPLDVLLLMDEPVFSGCTVPSRLIGVIEALTEWPGYINPSCRPEGASRPSSSSSRADPLDRGAVARPGQTRVRLS